MPQFWAGFVEGKLHMRHVDDEHGGADHGYHLAPAIFPRKRDAESRFEDVRKVEVRVISKSKTKRK
jgi:hypothetical protein